MIVQFSNSRSVDGKRSMRFRNETFVSKFLRRGVDIVNRGGTGYEARQTSKQETKMPRFILEGPRPCTMFCFLLIQYT